MKVFIWKIDYAPEIIIIAETIEKAREMYYLEGRMFADQNIDNVEPKIIEKMPCVISR